MSISLLPHSLYLSMLHLSLIHLLLPFHNLTLNHHPMQTRSKSGITKPNSKLCYKTILDYTFTEPPTYRIASKYPKWCEAMDAEF